MFEGLEIWLEEKYRVLQGTYPVISISFANVKETKNFSGVFRLIWTMWMLRWHRLKRSSMLLHWRRKEFRQNTSGDTGLHLREKVLIG